MCTSVLAIELILEKNLGLRIIWTHYFFRRILRILVWICLIWVLLRLFIILGSTISILVISITIAWTSFVKYVR